MIELLKEPILLFMGSLFTGFLGWFFGRKKAKTEVEANQIDNAEKLLGYYKSLADDMGIRLEKAIINLQNSEIEKQDVITKFKEATAKIESLEDKVEMLTNELMKYKQLNGKAN